MPYLEFNGQKRTLGPGVLIIGSGREAGWRIEDRRMDRVHALVSLERDGRVLLTRGSDVAWVELNGHPIATAAAEIRPGDEVRIGDAVFRLAAGVPHAPDEERGVAYLREVRRERYYRLGDVTAIGRDLTCAVLILDPDISRTHAEVLRDGEAYQVHPRRGVTLLNGHRLLAPAVLAEGDELMVGQTLLRYTTVAPPGGVTAQARVGAQAREAAQMQTTFMSPLAVRESMRKRRQRKVGAVIAGVGAAAAIAVLLVSAATRSGAGPASGARDSAAGAVAPAAGAADSAAPGAPGAAPAPAPAIAAESLQALPRLPDSVPPLESAPPSEEPITAGATKRPRP